MADYKQTDVAGQRWNRFSRIITDNPYEGTPSVLCVEQEVLSLGDGDEIVRDIGNLSFSFVPDCSFPLLNPDTNEPTGETATMSQIYVLMYSAVLAKAKERDDEHN